jgi:IS605 OrfB family transposase
LLPPDSKVLKQAYLGKDIGVKRKKIFERRERLRSLAGKGSHRANQSLKKLKKTERDFVRNRLGEIVKEITDMALRYDAEVSIENLKRFESLGKRANKKIMRIPFYKFKQLLERLSRNSTSVNILQAY